MLLLICAGICLFVDERHDFTLQYWFDQNGYPLADLKVRLGYYGYKLVKIGGMAPDKYPSVDGNLQVPDDGSTVICEQITIRKRKWLLKRGLLTMPGCC